MDSSQNDNFPKSQLLCGDSVMVTTSPINDSQTTGSGSQVTVSSPTFLLSKVQAPTQSELMWKQKVRVNAQPVIDS